MSNERYLFTCLLLCLVFVVVSAFCTLVTLTHYRSEVRRRKRSDRIANHFDTLYHSTKDVTTP